MKSNKINSARRQNITVNLIHRTALLTAHVDQSKDPGSTRDGDIPEMGTVQNGDLVGQFENLGEPADAGSDGLCS